MIDTSSDHANQALATNDTTDFTDLFTYLDQVPADNPFEQPGSLRDSLDNADQRAVQVQTEVQGPSSGTVVNSESPSESPLSFFLSFFGFSPIPRTFSRHRKERHMSETRSDTRPRQGPNSARCPLTPQLTLHLIRSSRRTTSSPRPSSLSRADDALVQQLEQWPQTQSR